jgi:hypothetical protein
MSVSPNLLKQVLKELSVEDKMTTTDQWLALDAWKKLLHHNNMPLGVANI